VAEDVGRCPALARVAIPLPDSLTRWRIVGLAMDGAESYDIGKATTHTRKALQVLSGLPPVVRGDDELGQKITLRNDSDRAMTVRVRAEGSAGWTRAVAIVDDGLLALPRS